MLPFPLHVGQTLSGFSSILLPLHSGHDTKNAHIAMRKDQMIKASSLEKKGALGHAHSISFLAWECLLGSFLEVSALGPSFNVTWKHAWGVGAMWNSSRERTVWCFTGWVKSGLGPTKGVQNGLGSGLVCKSANTYPQKGESLHKCFPMDRTGRYLSGKGALHSQTLS
jgi:hypothetical protein